MPRMTGDDSPIRISFTDALARMRAMRSRSPIKAAPESSYRDLLPTGSRWQPGMEGQPDCATCKGLGYVSFNVERGHEYFGKVFDCECRESDNYRRLS